MNRNDMLNSRPQRAQNGFALPSLDNSSSSSLMDAVVGGQQRPTASANAMPTLSEVARRSPNPAAAGSEQEDVQELERNLQKRRSLIPHLENELAELEAQIKAAEERLARAAGRQAVPATAQ